MLCSILNSDGYQCTFREAVSPDEARAIIHFTNPMHLSREVEV